MDHLQNKTIIPAASHNSSACTTKLPIQGKSLDPGIDSSIPHREERSTEIATTTSRTGCNPFKNTITLSKVVKEPNQINLRLIKGITLSVVNIRRSGNLLIRNRDDSM